MGANFPKAREVIENKDHFVSFVIFELVNYPHSVVDLAKAHHFPQVVFFVFLQSFICVLDHLWVLLLQFQDEVLEHIELVNVRQPVNHQTF